MMGIFAVIGVLTVIGLGYWLIIVTEGAYFGAWAVRLIYRFGARHYDDVRDAIVRDDQTVLLPLLERALSGSYQPQVLDVATGTGRVPLLLAGAPGFRGRIVGLDLTPEMLHYAQIRQAQLAPDAPIAWYLGEAGDLPWPDQSFDLVSCLEALEFFPRPRRALTEMRRVLRPGGTLLISKIPDNWARLLPGRALTKKALIREFSRLGFEDSTIMPWQPGHYELVIVRREPAAAAESVV
ncbi:MAG: class I SAM-dependent methyltransferase [Oscillochloris sp.]|nr:class I SAM-dependent methyltransferase [Oscillochloris sp.]